MGSRRGRDAAEAAAFVVDLLKQADLFDPFVREAPLSYARPSKP